MAILKFATSGTKDVWIRDSIVMGRYGLSPELINFGISMINDFNKYLQLKTDLNEDEIDYVISLAVSRKLRRNEFIL